MIHTHSIQRRTKKNISGFNVAARGIPYLVLTDLDRSECAPAKIREWLSAPVHPNLLFRIAVREIEAWLLADRSGLARLFGIAQGRILTNPDDIPDPKGALIDLARSSRWKSLREDIVPRMGSTARQGPAYNDRLGDFVRNR